MAPEKFSFTKNSMAPEIVVSTNERKNGMSGFTATHNKPATSEAGKAHKPITS